MKRFALLVSCLLSLVSISFAQSNPDTVNGWSLRRTVGNDSAQTYSRIVADTATEGTHSQAFYFSLPRNTYVEWQKSYSRIYVMPAGIQVWIRLNRFGIGQLQDVRFHFFVAEGDSLYPIGTPATIGIEQLNLWFEYTINRGAPSTFSQLALKLYFNPSTANGDAEVFFDDLRLLYSSGGGIDSIITLDRFGDDPTAVQELGGLPQGFSLSQNYPNPFNPATSIKYQVSSTSYVKLEAYNTLGQIVATLVDGEKEPGNYRVEFSGDNLPSGVYIYRLVATSRSGERLTLTRKMILMK